MLVNIRQKEETPPCLSSVNTKSVVHHMPSVYLVLDLGSSVSPVKYLFQLRRSSNVASIIQREIITIFLKSFINSKMTNL